MALFVILKTNANKEENKKTHVTRFVIVNECKQRAKQKTHVTLFVIVNECKQRAKQKARGTVCFHERR
jgi:prephenate dehydratase